MNERLEHYCKEFIESTENPQFAIFIKGEWGTGKTHFVNKLMESYAAIESQVKREEIIYISLFGVSSQAEIDTKIFQAIHPILSSKGMQLAGTIVRTALKVGANFDINSDGKSDGSISFGGMPSGKNDIKISGINKKLIVVDDLERAFLDPGQVFGYFSEIVNQSDCKVIFVGNEEQIADKDEKIKDKFNRIKEKTIGLEFQIEPDIQNALDVFLSEIPISVDSNAEIKDIINEVVSILECKNLRTIRQAIFNLRILINSIDEKIKDDHKPDIIRIFFVLYIQKSLGTISSKDTVDEAIIAFLKYRVSYKKYKENMEKEKNNFFYSLYDKYIPLSNCWKNIIFEGNYDEDYLSTEYEIENKVNSIEEPKNLFILLNTWRGLDRETFKILFDTVNKEVEEGKYIHPGEILHYFNIMAIFSKWSLIPESIDDIYKKVVAMIEGYKSKIVPIDDWSMLSMSYGGWGYSDGIPEMVRIKNILMEVTKENNEILTKAQIESDINIMEDDIREFCRNIIHVNGNSKYYRKPFFKLVNVEAFYEKMHSLSISDQEMMGLPAFVWVG